MRKVNRTQETETVRIPAPVGGLNTRDPLTSMPATDAYELTNMFPTETSVDVRQGYASFATVLNGAADPGNVEVLLSFDGGNTQALLAFAGGCIWDITAGGVNNTPLATGGPSSALVRGTMFSNAGAQYLVIAAGNANLTTYDGTGAPGLVNRVITPGTGPAVINFVYSYKGRLFLLGDNKLGFYYLPLGNIAGAASYFDLSQIAKRGGYVVAMASYSFDTGVGPGEFAVFITSLGEYIVYSGIDPSSAANWSLVSRYFASPPLGNRCAFNYRGDLIIITQEGVLPFSTIRSEGEEDGGRNALTDKISTAILLQDITSTAAWQLCAIPNKNMLWLNSPDTTNATMTQYVMNLRTRAWAKFNLSSPYMYCMELFRKDMYFGHHNGNVYKYGGVTKDGANGTIILAARQAYNSLGIDGEKQVTMASYAVDYQNSSGVTPLLYLTLGYNEETAGRQATNRVLPVTAVVARQRQLIAAGGEAALTVSPQLLSPDMKSADVFKWTYTGLLVRKIKGFP